MKNKAISLNHLNQNLINKNLLILILMLLGGFSSEAQLITFDDQGHTAGDFLPNPYTITNNGETFSFTISGGGATNHIYRTTENSCGSTGMSHIYSGNFPQTTWTIETTSGNEIDLGTIKFDNVFSCFGGFSYSLTIEGFKNNVSTGTQPFIVAGLNSIFTSNSSFDDVDKIVITATDLGQLGIDDINWSLNPLPVELLSFSAKEENDLLNLNWTTASEINNEKFEIEESDNGREFQKIAEVEGNGTTTEQQKYSFKVENPRKGILYYRLKQIDFDGKFEYSNIISVEIVGHQEIYISPNPSTGIIRLNNFSEGEIKIYDTSGRVLKTLKISDQEIDISDLPNGILFVQVITKTQNAVKRILKELR